jgi:hypothetical protein
MRRLKGNKQVLTEVIRPGSLNPQFQRLPGPDNVRLYLHVCIGLHPSFGLAFDLCCDRTTTVTTHTESSTAPPLDAEFTPKLRRKDV